MKILLISAFFTTQTPNLTRIRTTNCMILITTVLFKRFMNERKNQKNDENFFHDWRFKKNEIQLMFFFYYTVNF